MTDQRELLSLLEALDRDGLDAALLMLSGGDSVARLARHFQAAISAIALPDFEAVRPNDPRVRVQIATLRCDSATTEQRATAASMAERAAIEVAQDGHPKAARAAALAASWAVDRASVRVTTWGAEFGDEYSGKWSDVQAEEFERDWEAAQASREILFRAMIAEAIE